MWQGIASACVTFLQCVPGGAKGDLEAPKLGSSAAEVAVKEDGRIEDVDFKNLSIEEAFQVLGVSLRTLELFMGIYSVDHSLPLPGV